MINMTSIIVTMSFVMWSFNAYAQTPTHYSARVEQSGTVVCSEDPSEGCELSAVAWIKNGKDGYLVFGNDKPHKSPRESSIFSIPYTGGVFQERGTKTYYSFSPFVHASKLESMSVSPDGSIVAAMTAFDRYRESDSGLDNFNMFITWPINQPNTAKVIFSIQRDGVESSRALRYLLSNAIMQFFGDKATYFKVEGLALLPKNRILFGVREIGQSRTAFDYRVVLLEGQYEINNGEFYMDGMKKLEVVRDFSDVSDIVGRKVGLSSIEYDTLKNQLYVLTTYEDIEEKRMGAYLWVLPDENGKLGTAINLVRTSDGAPFEFSHKAEGLAVLDDGRIFIIHDDDRYLSNVRIGGVNGGQLRVRKYNEAAFDILQICSNQASHLRRDRDGVASRFK